MTDLTRTWRPFSLAIFRKTLGDELALIVTGSIVVLAFQVVFVAAMAELAPEAMEFWRRFEFMKQIFLSLFNVNLDDQINLQVLSAVGLAHPMLLVISLGGVIATCTRVITGEWERGTADLLLALPEPRWRIYVSVTMAWLLTATSICTAAWCGVAIGGEVAELSEPLRLERFAVALLNLLLLLIAAGGFVMCIATFCQRRSIAVGVSIGVLLASYLLGFFEAFFDIVKYFSWASMLNYFQPTDVVRDGAIPLASAAGLLTIAVLFWTAGLIRFQTRDVYV